MVIQKSELNFVSLYFKIRTSDKYTNTFDYAHSTVYKCSMCPLSSHMDYI